MVKKSSNPILRVAVGFAAGIAAYNALPISPDFIYYPGAALVLAALYLLYVIYPGSNHHNSLIPGLVTVLAFTLSGMLAAHVDHCHAARVHNSLPVGSAYYYVQIAGAPQPAGSHTGYVVKTLAVYRDSAWAPGQGKGMLYIKSDTTAYVQPGTSLLIRGKAALVQPPRNPGEFDYRSYLHRKGIFYRDYVHARDVLEVRHGKRSRSIFFLRINRALRQQLNRVAGNPENQAIAAAMLLGDKKGISDELRSAYSAAGASHILAVSGLHVGIIFFVLHGLLADLRRRATTRMIFYGLVLAGIWTFAAITAFSPSVTRAGIMISFVLIGQAIRSGSRMLNSLSAAAFIMLLYDTDMLYDVGFQLSFGAVAGIALFNNGIYRAIRFDHRAADYLWKLVALSVAVQIAIAPLVAHYFHQFPLLFPATNIVVIPATAIILVCTILLLSLSFVFAPIGWAGNIYDALTGMLNDFVRSIESLPFSHIDHIAITPIQTALLTCLLLCAGRFLFYGATRLLAPAALSALLLLLLLVVEKRHINQREQMIVYSYPRTVLIDFMKGRQWAGYAADTNAAASGAPYILNSARLAHHMAPGSRVPIREQDILRGPGWDCLVFAEKKILVVKSTGLPRGTPLPAAPDLMILKGGMTSRGLSQVLDINPGYLLIYGNAFAEDQLDVVRRHRDDATWADLSRAFIYRPEIPNARNVY